MKSGVIWFGLRPVVSILLAVVAWIATMSFTHLFPNLEAGKFLSDQGFLVAGPMFLFVLLVISLALQLRWWDALAPAIIPILIVGLPSDYWSIRVWLAFVSPFAISAGFAEYLRWRRRQAQAATTHQ